MAQAQNRIIPHHQDKPPGPALSPQQAIAKMKVPPGFTVELVAAEPNLVNPVSMAFDDRGRIWVTESLEYPRRTPGVGRDRIKILEDTDGDGVAEKVTIFADGLNIPSGIEVGYGGVWVANSPDLLFLQDTDGDDKADRREVVVTGFGRTDTHELPNSLTWGPDGWLYGLNGVFNHSHIEYRGKVYDFTCAMFRVHPQTRDFELFAEGTSNPWGIAWNDDGSAFLSACVIDHLWHLTETGYYHRQGGPYPPHTWKIGSIVKHKHQKAAYCGIHYFDSDAYPPEYRGRLYMGNIHGNCLNVDKLERDGSTYFATPAPDFLTADDAWFMPVSQMTGPDGCLYVLDWYDQYHCYQDANRDPAGIDRLKGRLYRIRYQNTPRVANFDLAAESDDQLIARIRNEHNDFTRYHARRILAERHDAQSREKLIQLTFDTTASKQARMHALWTLISAGPLPVEFHQQLLTHDDPLLRAWAVRAAGNAGQVDAALSQRISELVNDPSADVRLQTAITAGKLDELETVPMLVQVLAASQDDKLIPHIVWQNLQPLLEEHTDEFLQLAIKHDLAASPHAAEFMPRVLERILSREKWESKPVGQLLAMLVGSESAQAQQATAACLSALRQRVQNREIAGEQLTELRADLAPPIKSILAKSSTNDVYFQAAMLATAWRDPIGVAAARKVVTGEETVTQHRIAALEALISAGDDSVPATVEHLLSQPKQFDLSLRGRVLAAAARFDRPEIAEVVLRRYDAMEPDLQPKAVELLTQRRSWSSQLLAAIGAKTVPANALNLNQVRRMLATGDEALVKQVQASWGTVRDTRNPNREQFIAQMKRTIRQSPGDAQAGEQHFKKICAQCHRMYGAGADVGPDITRNGRNSFDQLLSNVFDPSLVIGSAYRAFTVVTVDGRVLTGLLVEDTDQRVVLKVQGGKIETIARRDIEIAKASELSMMPEELEKQLKPQQIVDLFAYLTLDRPPSDPQARQLPGVREIIPVEAHDPAQFAGILGEVAPGFTTNAVGEGGVALLKEHFGRSAVVRTHPVSQNTPCVLHGTFDLPANQKSKLQLVVGHHLRGDWELIVKVNGKRKFAENVGPKTTSNKWTEFTVDLSEFADKTVVIEIQNAANGWSWEFGYWGRVEIVHE